MRAKTPLLAAATLGTLAATAAATSFVTPSDWARGDAGSSYFEWQFFVTGTGLNPPTEAVIPAGATASIQDTSGSSVVAGSGSLYNQPGVSQIEVNFETEAADTGRWVTNVHFQSLTLGREFAYDDMRVSGIAFDTRTELERIFLGVDGPFGGYISRNLFVFRVPGQPQMTLNAPAEDLSLSLDDAIIDTFSTPTCAGDVDLDFDVDINDLLAMLSAFGTDDALADFDFDGAVGIDELLTVLSDFGCTANNG